MDMFFEVYDKFKYDFWLRHVVKYAEGEIIIKVYSDKDLIVIQKGDSDQVEWAYIMAAKSLVDWLERNYHAKSSTRRGEDGKWTKKLSELLNVDAADNND